MRLFRSVPLTPGLMAVAEASESDTLVVDDEFSNWWNDRARRPGGAILDQTSMSVEEVTDLLTQVPDTPAGAVWKQAVQKSLALTLADTLRPFDQGEWDDAEQPILDGLDALAESLRDTSPLLSEVADTIIAQSPGMTRFYLGDVHEARDRLTADGVVLGSDGWCDKHGEHCYGDHRSVAKWEHIDYIAPGTHDRLTSLLESLDAALPVMGEHDNGKARYGRRYV